MPYVELNKAGQLNSLCTIVYYCSRVSCNNHPVLMEHSTRFFARPLEQTLPLLQTPNIDAMSYHRFMNTHLPGVRNEVPGATSIMRYRNRISQSIPGCIRYLLTLVSLMLRETTDFLVRPKATAIGKWTNTPRCLTSCQ